MRYQPKTEADVSPLLKPGVYDFTVTNAEDRQSKSGNDMIALELEVFTETGGIRRLKDYLLEKVAYKLRHFCYATGMGDLYESGQFGASDCVGRSGKLKLGVQSQEGYQDKNEVRDYEVIEGGKPTKVLPPAQAAAVARESAQVAAAVRDDEPPF